MGRLGGALFVEVEELKPGRHVGPVRSHLGLSLSKYPCEWSSGAHARREALKPRSRPECACRPAASPTLDGLVSYFSSLSLAANAGKSTPRKASTGCRADNRRRTRQGAFGIGLGLVDHAGQRHDAGKHVIGTTRKFFSEIHDEVISNPP